MKSPLFALVAMLVSVQANAFTVCSGETYTHTFVTVQITTSGAMGKVEGGKITIAPAAEVARTYDLKKEEIPQFFESVSDDGQKAVVGLSAYVNSENPISIRYSGTNFQEGLIDTLRNPFRMKEAGNEMRVWKGPGFPADQQHQFRDVVCQVTLDP